MIDSINAIGLIRKQCSPFHIIEIPIESAMNHVISQDILAPMDFPPFAQSAMDGYVIAEPGHSHYKVISTCKAGDHHSVVIKSNEAIRIFTGAMVPAMSFAVIPQEHVRTTSSGFYMLEHVNEGDHIRLKGEQIHKGEIALKKGTKLNPSNIGLLASTGITLVKVFKPPRVGIINTGSELCKHDQSLISGKIYESNSFMLKAAFQKEGIHCTSVYAEDEIVALKEAITPSLKTSDLIVLTGGISEGDYDLVRKALDELGAETVLYKVAQKPGKALYVGKLNNKLVFGLPGNPGAALTCFYIYVIPAIRAIQGMQNTELLRTFAELENEYFKRGPLTHFMKGVLHGKSVSILRAQNSRMLNEFGSANCLVVLKGTDSKWKKGDNVEIILLPD